MPTIRKREKRRLKARKQVLKRHPDFRMSLLFKTPRNRHDSRACTYVTDQENPFPHQCPDGRERYGGGGGYVRVKKARKSGSEGMVDKRKDVKKGKRGK